jgi:hypothetical protein
MDAARAARALRGAPSLTLRTPFHPKLRRANVFEPPRNRQRRRPFYRGSAQCRGQLARA